MQKRKRHQMVGFLYSHIRPQRQLLKEDRQVIPILESLSSDYQPRLRTAAHQEWSLSNVLFLHT